MSTLSEQTEKLKTASRKVQHARIDMRKINPNEMPKTENLKLSNKIAEFFDFLTSRIREESNRYVEPTKPTEKKTGQEPQEEISNKEPALPKPILKIPRSPFTSQIARQMDQYFSPQELPEAANQPITQKLLNMSLPEQTLALQFIREVTLMSDQLGNYGTTGLATLQKMRKSKSYVLDKNYSGAHRLLKAAKTSDPHNNTLAYIISQLEYFMVINSHQTEFLPNARSEAQKASAINDNTLPHILLRYRYDCISCEAPLSDKRAIEWIQESYMLDPEQMQGQGGLTRHEALHLKTWVLLSDTPSKLWGDYIFTSMQGLITNTVGGASFYLHLLRKKTLDEISKRPVPPKGVKEIEDIISHAYLK